MSLGVFLREQIMCIEFSDS